MKKVIIIHGWSGNSEGCWIPWIKEELEDKGFEVATLDMPDTEHPKINEWVNYLKTHINPNDKTYLIGHSIGCQAIMRYAEQTNTEIEGTLLVAGWFDLDNLETEYEREVAKPWIETPINFEKVKKNIKKISVLISEDEPFGFVNENARIFKEKLNANVFIEKNYEHFTDLEMPIILSKFLEMAK